MIPDRMGIGPPGMMETEMTVKHLQTMLVAYNAANVRIIDRAQVLAIAAGEAALLAVADERFFLPGTVGMAFHEDADAFASLKAMGERNPGVLMMLSCRDLKDECDYELWGLDGVVSADYDGACQTSSWNGESDVFGFDLDKARQHLASR